ncbi:leader peptidase (prepilin peptidase) / N-methyltransferase [Cohnella sp. OV330]|uniref:prepilin peptidase n=1 Tax=Cohnella sp. OV330 TaxID=1855288 RepID=UPI0008E95899|nr:A24 family peptidase [Cohnella sp. OV330]SFA94578.1 leader peptidase (prepilin peptidase) / N-methyltransferase [Cohnella sp. OV330]
MTILLYIYLFALGAVLGSFYNVVALRVPAGESIVSPPSRCPRCGTRLTGRDLVPIASWLLSRGRCRHCKAPVSPLYPLGEAATGLLFVWVYATFGWSPAALIGLLLVSLCVIVTVSDLTTMLIPNKVLLFFAPFLAAACLLLPNKIPWWSHLLGAVAGGGILLLIVIVSKGGMGLGDVKLFAVLGFVVGLPNAVVALVAACLAGTLVGVALIAFGVVKRKQPVPFGPFLALGACFAYGYGADAIDYYLSLFT